MPPPWFHGRLDRNEAEEVLTLAGCTNGLFLVRTSSTHVDVYDCPSSRQRANTLEKLITSCSPFLRIPILQ